MKLYATITSERASKGQGGKTLHIVIRNEKEEPCIALYVITDNTGRVQANMYCDIIKATVKSQVTFIEDKGKKQKTATPRQYHTEDCVCINCNSR